MIELGDNWLAGADRRNKYTFGVENHIYCKHDYTVAGGASVQCAVCKRKVPKAIIKKFNFIFPEDKYK